jgi:hypothetical protein
MMVSEREAGQDPFQETTNIVLERWQHLSRDLKARLATGLRGWVPKRKLEQAATTDQA